MSDAHQQNSGEYGKNPSPMPDPTGDPKDPQNPYGGQPKPPAPCNDPKPPDKPTDPKPPDCPPPTNCPPPKPCPDPPTRPPDPCDDTTTTPPSGTPAQTGGGTATTGGATTGGGTTDSGTSSGGGKTDAYAGATPAQHLDALKKQYEDGQKELQKLEPLKNQQADLAQRITAFEKTLDGQSTSDSAYKDFYKSIDLLKHDIDCFVPTARCQLDLTDKAKKCVCDAIATVTARVDKAKNDAAAQHAIVDQLDADARRAARDLDWTKKWYDYLKTNLQQQISTQRDDVKKLKGLVTPSANPCEAYFYLIELERLIQSSYGQPDACWKDDIWIATFLDCWPPENYSKAWNKVLVDFNKADAADKLAKSKLDQAKKLLADLEKAAGDAVAKRRDWILKEIKTKDCCGPTSKCP